MSSGQGLRAFIGRLAPSAERPFPWRAPRHELLLLVLVGLVALSPVYHTSDAPRTCLAQALLHGRLSNDECLAQSFDRARYGAHLYSDKAPGLALLDVPSVALLSPGLPSTWPNGSYLRLWGVRVLSIGIAFLLCAFLVGRVSEGLAPGFGGIALVSLALGTMMAPLAVTSYEHILSGLLGFAGFLLAWRRRPALAGLALGAAFLVDYEAALMLAIVAAYVLLRGLRPLARYLAGALPGVVLVGGYSWAAFGAPWHLSYRYIDNVDASFQGNGLFGIGTPRLFGVVEVFAGRSGLLIVSPVLVLAAYGLVRLGREQPAEALVCALVSLAFILVNVSYFQPYGGETFGPRFVAPALPFLALGLGPAFRALPRLSSLAAAASVLAASALTLVWASHITLRQTVWGELARVPAQLGRSLYVESLTATIYSELGASRALGALLLGAFAVAAFTLALRSIPWDSIREARKARKRRSGRALLVGVAAVYLLAGADVCAVFAYPYGDRTYAFGLPTLSTYIQSSTTAAYPGSEVNFGVFVADSGAKAMSDVSLTIDLPAGMKLLGRPAVGSGSLCTGNSTLVCYVDYVNAESSTWVRLGVAMIGKGEQTISAAASSNGIPAANRSSASVRIGT